MSDITDNAPELSVTELSGALKRTVEDRFGYVRVRGEVSGWRGPHSSGHVYFALKDQGAKIDAVMWKGVFQRLRVKPEEGMEVIATGKITTYPNKSSYQIIVESIEPAGVGALLAQLEDRRRRLAGEGLFDDARKQLLPFIPRTIGVITSPTGAVIRDILHRIADRFPVRVVVWPVRVQGDTCAMEVTRAIEGFNALPEGGALARPDVIIVARGGGSLEDLWGFNDEALVRAAAASMIPLVSAVGHETDWTLIDHASDRRAPTPTAAAEMCVPVRSDLIGQVDVLARRQHGAMMRLSERRRSEMRALVRAMPDAQDLLAMPRQRLDRAGDMLPARANALLRDHSVRLAQLGALVARHSPYAELARRRERLAGLSARLNAGHVTVLRREAERMKAFAGRLEMVHERLRRACLGGLVQRRNAVSGLTKLLASFDHRSVLARGFALVRGVDGGQLVRSVAQIAPGQGLSIEFADGRAAAIASGDEAPPASSAPMRPRAPAKTASRGAPKTQGDLF